jgi:hypothetical protein
LLVEEFKCKRPLKSNSKVFTQDLASIEKHVEQRYGRVTACRVVLKAPGGHHRTGGLYEVNIHRERPRGQCRAHPAGGRARLSFAINDAFKHARRRLQDHIRRLQGQVKQHEGQPTANVKTIDASGEFGFLEAADDHEVYFHRNSAGLVRYARCPLGLRLSDRGRCDL